MWLRLDLADRVNGITDMRYSQASDHKVLKKHLESLMRLAL